MCRLSSRLTTFSLHFHLQQHWLKLTNPVLRLCFYAGILQRVEDPFR